MNSKNKVKRLEDMLPKEAKKSAGKSQTLAEIAERGNPAEESGYHKFERRLKETEAESARIYVKELKNQGLISEVSAREMLSQDYNPFENPPY
jgi:hypothetical protein